MIKGILLAALVGIATAATCTIHFPQEAVVAEQAPLSVLGITNRNYETNELVTVDLKHSSMLGSSETVLVGAFPLNQFGLDHTTKIYVPTTTGKWRVRVKIGSTKVCEKGFAVVKRPGSERKNKICAFNCPL
jgi:hypothetical protein